MIKSNLRLIGLISSVLLVSACTDAPKQYDTTKGQGAGQKTPDKVGTQQDAQIFTNENSGEEDQDLKARDESFLPIIYGQGTEKTTFETTLEETMRKVTEDGKENPARLSEPRVSPSRGTNGWAVYGSGMWVNWRLDDPKVPNSIRFTKSYSGKMDTGSPKFGKIGARDSFASWLSGTTADVLVPQADKLAIELFNALEKKEEGFNCRELQICQHTVGVVLNNNENPSNERMDVIAFHWDKFVLLLSLDEKEVVLIALFNPLEPGVLQNDVDLLTGRFQVPADEIGPSQEATIGLDQTWAKIHNDLNPKSYTNVYSDAFIKDYQGVRMGITKSVFDEAYKQPNPEEMIQSVSVGEGFNRFILFGGNYILAQPGKDRFQVGIVPKEQGDAYLQNMIEQINPEKPKETLALIARQGAAPFLTLSTRIRGEANKITFMEDLAKIVSDEVKKTYPLVNVTHSGRHKRLASGKSFVTDITAYDPAAKEGAGSGLRVQYSMYTRNQKDAISYTLTSRLNNAANKIIVPAIAKGYNGADPATNTTMAGFHLGREIHVSDMDINRGEANVRIPMGEGQDPITVRGGYIDKGSMRLSFNGSGFDDVKVQAVRISDFRILLGLAKIKDKDGQHTQTPDGAYRFRVVSITTPGLWGNITGVCGNLTTQVSMPTSEFKKRFDEQYQATQCRHLDENFDDGTGLLSSFYFPGKVGVDHTHQPKEGEEPRMMQFGVKIDFSESETGAVTIYSK